jgi:hypothetical protein
VTSQLLCPEAHLQGQEFEMYMDEKWYGCFVFASVLTKPRKMHICNLLHMVHFEPAEQKYTLLCTRHKIKICVELFCQFKRKSLLEVVHLVTVRS